MIGGEESLSSLAMDMTGPSDQETKSPSSVARDDEIIRNFINSIQLNRLFYEFNCNFFRFSGLIILSCADGLFNFYFKKE